MIRHFISYPKSGRTWIRYVLTQLDVDSQILFHHDGFEFNDAACPSHNFDIAQRLEQYSRVEKLVYLERDPRDVIVSLFFQVTGRFKDFFEYQGNISEFIRNDYFGAENLHRFRKMWADIMPHRQFLTISYEECHRDMIEVMRKMLNYYELDVDPSRLFEAVENAEFSRMKRLEESETFPHPWLRPRQGSLKVRQGKISGFREILNEEDICYLNSVFLL